MARIQSVKLNHELKRNIAAGKYGRQELEQIYQKIREFRDTRKVAMRRAWILIAVTVVLITAMTLMPMARVGAGVQMMAFTTAAVILVVIAAMLLAWYLTYGRLVLQFNAALRKGYPVLSEKYKL